MTTTSCPLDGDGAAAAPPQSSSRHGGCVSGVGTPNAALLITLYAGKRLADIGAALCLLLLGLPLMLAVAAAVRIGGPGPVLYGHRRVGRRGRFFTAWKFRTMRPDGDDVLRRHLKLEPAARAEWERDRKLRHDPRVTPVGRVLRRLSLDELPQLWNVLRGEMSLVGPRPVTEDEARRYGEGFRLYAGVRPGITGLWHVSGRNGTTYEERVELDLYYVRHWSPWLDARILAKTVPVVALGKGAY
jgi:Undecaprenyl-phosphate galactose phosphotransferase WbaP